MTDWPGQPDTLVAAAMRALERDAATNPEARRLLRSLQDLPPICGHWYALKILQEFRAEAEIPAYGFLMAAVLRELSESLPVPRAPLQ